MAIVTPPVTSAADINTELGVASTSQVQLSSTSVQYLAARPPTFVSSTSYNLGSGSVTAPAGATFAEIRGWGGGGGSASSANYGAGSGGAFFLKRVNVVGGVSSISYSVGAGGAAGTTAGANGENTTATFNSTTYFANGGIRGTTSSGGTQGSGTVSPAYSNNVDLGFNGSPGTSGTRPTTGGNAGGSQEFEGGTGVAGAVGNIPGAGGGTSSTSVSNRGANGRIRITWYEPNTISFSQLRWGISFPARKVVLRNNTTTNNEPAYSTSDTTTISSFAISGSAAMSTNTIIELTSSGTLRYKANNVYGSLAGETANLEYTKTWLVAGSASDYTANLVLTSGSVAGSQTNTDLPLSSTRLWYSSQTFTTVPNPKIVSGFLLIKNDGVELIRRPFRMIGEIVFFGIVVPPPPPFNP